MLSLLFILIDVFTYGVFTDPNSKPLTFVGLYHIITDIIPTWLIISQMVRVVWWYGQGHANSNIGWSRDLNPYVVVQNSGWELSWPHFAACGGTRLYCVTTTQVAVQGIGRTTNETGLSGPIMHFLPQHVEERIIKVFNRMVAPRFRKSVTSFSCAAWYLLGLMRQDFPELGRTWLSNWMRVSLFSPR